MLKKILIAPGVPISGVIVAAMLKSPEVRAGCANPVAMPE